ncbi:glycoside hydrolase family 81 [Pyrenophora seminiperda CCB06]|uniref:glucan endo-1,3-beta-D-glucosidase n=1 Tax=Pyrenophora seminiperda CCB06 TaxID=1302712 RepID=A0A3M7M561_9PLEO|nr:glycoside hydrolase family 81 [Pyrenophora seminiperda CCB06]
MLFSTCPSGLSLTSLKAIMAKLATFLLASAPFLTSVRGLPAAGDAKAAAARAITLSSLPVTTSYSTAIESLQTATATAEPSITGSFLTGLPSGGFTQNPVSGPGTTTATVSLAPNETPLDPGPTDPLIDPASPNIFQPIATGAPPPSIPSRNDHPVQKKHIADGDVPIETNKFYANWFLVWTNPYVLTWAKGTGGSYERNQYAYAPDATNTKYFIAPLGIYHIVLSAAELQQDTSLSLERTTGFSAYANLRADGNAGTRILVSFPVVQGMGMTTALYDTAKPVISSTVFFRSLDYVGMVNGVTHKYRIVLNDGSNWLLYATAIGSVGTPPFTLVNSNTITGPDNFVGRIQVTKNPVGASAEAAFDSSAGAYAITATISGSTSGSTGSYTLSWTKGGVTDRPLLMYALPHHVESFDSQTQAALAGITLVTTTKGYAQAIVADHMTMVENDLPTSIGFGPWVKNANNAAGGYENTNLNANAISLINQVGVSELSQNMIPQTSLNSMYYSGKGLAKFATIIYTLNSITKNSQYAAAGLDRLKDAFNVFVNNTQPEPLVYDQVWKGIVSGASYKAPIDTGLDFGNTLYNDHHFHYGYFVYTAAVIGHLDPTWLDKGINKAWVNGLVRDFANPIADDYYFPFQRSFDWYHGHSWAKGLFESGDGKDQESTSEDTFATFGMKMWGRTIGDANMEARGNLQLAVQARSIHNYFLMESDNKNQPAGFIHNKATGILFENKIDHTTYFGANPEYIEGIHMIPLNPSSAYTRRKQFVQEEWDTYFSSGRAEQVTGGWRGILKANQCLIDAQSAYSFFSSPSFNEVLDGGASRTWYLAYTAAQLGIGSPGAFTDADGQSNSSDTNAVEPATPVSSGMVTMASTLAAPEQTNVEALDMSWALQDKNVEERSSDSEWEAELECDDDDEEEEEDGGGKRSWWDLLL